MKRTLNPRYVKLILCLILLAGGYGCSRVISKSPVGEKSARVAGSDWEGEWITTDASVKVKVVDADKGLLKVFWLDDDQKGNPVMRTADVELRESGGWTFANTKEENKGASRGFRWGRIKNEERQVVLWLPDDKAFAQLVKSGVLHGKFDGDEVIPDELKPEHLKLITSGERGLLFSWDRPVVFVKVGK